MVGLANSTKLFAPEDGPLNLPKRHWRTRLRIPEVSAIKGKVSGFYKILDFIEAAHAVKSVQTLFEILL